MMVYATTDTKKGRTGISPTYLHTASKAKVCNGRRHVPLCPACANEK